MGKEDDQSVLPSKARMIGQLGSSLLTFSPSSLSLESMRPRRA